MPDGFLSIDDLRTAAAGGAVDTVICAFPDLYGRLVGKRIDAGFFLEDPEGGTHACDYLFTVDMEMEPVAGYAFANWEKGYGDVHLVPDMATLRVLSWLDRTALVICDAHAHDHAPVAVAPRSVLRHQVERVAGAGFTMKAASELEYFLYRTSYQAAAASGYCDLPPAGWYIEDYHLLQAARTEDLNGAFRRHLADSGVPVESTKGEWGRGQHELNVRYADALDMADRHVLLKQCVKEVAEQLGAAATFMAKPHADEAGNSCHIHASLWSGPNAAFPGGQDLSGIACSDTFRWFLGGWMAHARDLTVLYAPTVNSYKRFQVQSWAPTRIAWSPDNRTAGFRVVGSGPALRIECRLAGADVNPYLAYAALIAAGLDGIENKIEPPDPVLGDVYVGEGLPTVPATLRAATDLFEASDLARLAFGDEFVDHYVHFSRTEQAAFDAAVTDWERVRYFERI